MFFFYKNKLKKNNKNYLNYFTNLTMKKGLKLKALAFVKNGFKEFFELFLFCNDTRFIKKFYYFSILKSYSSSWSNFYSINKFLDLLLPMFEFIFTFRCVKIDKKLMKKKKEPYKLVLSYLKKQKRLFYVIKTIFYYANSFNNKNISKNIFYALTNTFLYLKNSYVYKQKLKFYKKVLFSTITSSSSTGSTRVGIIQPPAL